MRLSSEAEATASVVEVVTESSPTEGKPLAANAVPSKSGRLELFTMLAAAVVDKTLLRLSSMK